MTLLLLALLHGVHAFKPTAAAPTLSLHSAFTLFMGILLTPVVAYALRALWLNPEVPIVARLLWARAKEAAGVRVSARQLTEDLVSTAKRYAKDGAEGRGAEKRA
jgi:hypothetical protein